MQQYAIYLRKSRKDAATETLSETLARHEARLIAVAAQQQLSITQIYREVVSGDSIATRPQMLQLLRDVRQGRWHGVLVVELERLARGDPKDQGLVAEAFQYSHTKIITPTKTYDPDNEFDEEYFEFGLFMSRREYKTIKRRLQAGILCSIQAGNYLPPLPPFGYDIVKHGRHDRTLYPNADAATVRLIYQWYTETSCSYTEIAQRLTALHFKTATGRSTWSASSVAKILHNDVYIGKVHYGQYRNVRQFEPNTGNILQSLKKSAQTEIIVADGKHPPLISNTTWQQAVARHTSTPLPAQKALRNSLAGLLRCAICGRHMQYKTTRRAGQLYAWFSHRSGSGCNCAGIRAPVLLAALSYVVIQQCPQSVLLLPAETVSSSAMSIPHEHYQQRRAELEVQRQRIFDLFETGQYTQAEFLERRQQITDALTALKNTPHTALPSPSSGCERTLSTIQLQKLLENAETAPRSLLLFYQTICRDIRYRRINNSSPFTLEVDFQ